jgi:membrane-associated phospholipid phosphatase
MADARAVLRRYFDEQRPMSDRDRASLMRTAAILTVVGLAGFAFILWSVVNNAGAAVLDEPLRQWFVELRAPGLDGAMWLFSLVTGPVFLPILMAVLTAGWIWMGKHAWRPTMLAGGMLLGVLIAIIIRDTVDKPRPSQSLMVLFHPDHTYSFISGHTLGATNFALLGFYVLYSRHKNPKPWMFWGGLALALLWILASASSRLYTGFHWFTDVTGSICVALVILGLVIAVDTRHTAVPLRAASEDEGAPVVP